MIHPVLRFAYASMPNRAFPFGLVKNKAQSGHIFGCGKLLLAGSLLLSLVLHGLGAWVLELRPVPELIMDRLVLLDIVAPEAVSMSPVYAPPEAVKPADVPLAGVFPPVKTSVRSPEPPSAPQEKVVLKQKTISPAKQQSTGQEAAPLKSVKATAAEPIASAKPLVPIGQVVPQSGVTVLANESGQDTLKHGAEARFMHGVATEEFVEENYIGEYSLGKLGRVWIEDDREHSGHLILHVEGLGLTRPLFRFNRFIYVYGENPDSPEPILGSVTFFSDGDHIHQFLMQHNSTHAYYPRRN